MNYFLVRIRKKMEIVTSQDRPSPQVQEKDDPLVAGEEEENYPEGGVTGWLVVLGCFCGVIGAFGMMNTIGICMFL